MEALANLALARRAELSREEMTLFAGELHAFEPADVKAALRTIGNTPRKQYEPSIPDLGSLIAACKHARHARIEASFPPRPELATERPRFTPCSGPHYAPGWKVYVDSRGNPTSPEESPNRMLGDCTCLREFRDAEATWNHEVWAPHMREYHAWEVECEEIRLQHLALSEAA